MNNKDEGINLQGLTNLKNINKVAERTGRQVAQLNQKHATLSVKIWSDLHDKKPLLFGGDNSEDGDVVVDLGSVLLGDALADPGDVPALLLLQLQECVEDAKVELLHERVYVQVHLKSQ